MENTRLDALVQAVVARHQDESPEATVKRAEAFHAFLVPAEQGDTAEG